MSVITLHAVVFPSSGGPNVAAGDKPSTMLAGAQTRYRVPSSITKPVYTLVGKGVFSPH